MKLTKEQYDALPDGVKAMFEAEGDGYRQKAVSDPSDELKRAKDREVQARKDAEANANALQKKLDELDTNDARKRGDIDTLEKSWNDKYTTLTDEFNSKIAKKDAFIQDTLVNSVASTLAGKISTSPALILPHIKARLAADLDGDNPATKVLDANGAISAFTLDDLEKEFVANKDFASIIVGSKATGARDTDKSKSVPRGDTTDQNLASMKPTELLEHMRAKKEANQE